MFYNCRSILFTLNESLRIESSAQKIIETIKFCRTRICYNILAFFGLQEGTIAEIEGLFVGHRWSDFVSPDEFEPGSVEPDASVSFVTSDRSDSILTASVGSDFEMFSSGIVGKTVNDGLKFGICPTYLGRSESKLFCNKISIRRCQIFLIIESLL